MDNAIWPEFILKSIGVPAVVGGLAGWLGKVWAERIKQRELHQHRRELERQLRQLQEQIDRRQFVHRLQFETEFKAYDELWAAAFELFIAEIRVQTRFEDQLGNLQCDDELTRLTAQNTCLESLETLNGAADKFYDCFQHLKPFISTSVYAIANKLSVDLFVIHKPHSNDDASARALRLAQDTEFKTQNA